jgi:hypothetical protein
MAELGVGMRDDVFFEKFPPIMIITDFFAKTANRKDALQSPDSYQSITQFGNFCGQSILKGYDSLTDRNPGTEFSGIVWFDQVIVSACLQTLNNIVSFTPACQHDDIRGALRGGFTYPAADFQPIKAGHHPVEDGQTRRIMMLNCP